MPEIPAKWTTLNVRDYFSHRGNFPSNLRLKRIHNSSKIYAQWLPSEDEDSREFQGRCKGGKGKRILIQESMETDNPEEASKKAIKWVEGKQKEMRELLIAKERTTKNSLSVYWDAYFSRESSKRKEQRNFVRWSREEKLKWEAEEYGIGNQSWAKTNADLINRADFEEYFALLEQRALKSGGSNGSGMKAQQKTLINKLLVLAEKDFVGHQFPSFPSITKQTKQVTHFTSEQWTLLLQTVFELTEGKEAVTRSPSDYNSLKWNPYNRQCIRNWVDLYDALILEWFFYLRAEDMYRLKSEWFTNTEDDEWVLNLETTKKDRQLHKTTHFRKDAGSYVKRILQRKPEGYLIFPNYERPLGNEADSGVLGTLNFLLKKVIEKCLPEFPPKGRIWTTIRHTAFRLTLEDDSSLGVPPQINAFADNGHTSPQQLRDTYLRFIDLDKTAKQARAKIEPSRNIRWGGKYKSKKDIEETKD